MSAPVSHIEEGHKLTLDGLVDLFEVTLNGTPAPTVIRFKDHGTVVWQGLTWEHMPCQFAGDGRTAEDEEARPTLRVVNPAGLFNSFVMAGYLERALVVRKRLLRTHLEQDINIFEQRMWYVGRVRELLSGQAVTVELRNMSEGPNQVIPVRQYIPPDFPFVSF